MKGQIIILLDDELRGFVKDQARLDRTSMAGFLRRLILEHQRRQKAIGGSND